MKPWVTVLAWSLLAASPIAAHASQSLEFDAGGHAIAMEVGDDAAPTLARVRYFAPGDAAGLPLRPQDLRVERFDVGRRRLQLHYRGGGGVPAFELSVDGDRGLLEIGGRRLAAPFDWQM